METRSCVSVSERERERERMRGEEARVLLGFPPNSRPTPSQVLESKSIPLSFISDLLII